MAAVTAATQPRATYTLLKMPSNLSSFGLPETLRCGLGIRRAATNAATAEEAASKICQFLYDELVTSEGERACALIRCYKTHPFGQLKPADREFARVSMGGGTTPTPSMRCLTLLATVGDEQKWNDRRRSKGHRAIPLPAPEIVEKAPMIAQLIKQFGLEISAVVRPSADVIKDLEGKTYGVFHVPEAAGSPYIPAQDEFVLKYNIRSVVGCGGSLRGELFALILFARVHITPESADRFRTLALDLKSALFTFDENRVFAGVT